MIKNDNRGGGTILDFMGRHSCYEGDIELTGGVPLPPLGKTLEKYDLQMLSLCYNPNTIHILLSENITKHKSK